MFIYYYYYYNCNKNSITDYRYLNHINLILSYMLRLEPAIFTEIRV